MNFPLSIADWRDCFSRRGALGTAQVWLEKLAGVAAHTQRAALTALPPVPVLQRRFLDAWAQRDTALGGVPFLAKDLFATRGDATGAGSCFLAALLGPAGADASLIAQARSAGAVLCGKTQLNEFALGMSGENPHFGDCPHPRHPDLLSGGSSSGSAWAVGAGLVPFAFGTDTAGSIRVPAAFCGVHGVRLEPGLLDAEELFPLSPSFDTPGWFARTTEDLRLLAGVLLGTSEKTTAPPARILWLGCDTWVSPEVAQATGQFAQDRGFLSDPDAAALFATATAGVEQSYPVLGASEAARLHGRWLEQHRAEYDPVVWARLDTGRRRAPEEIADAERHRRAIHAAFAELFSRYDAVALPATPLPALPKSGQTEALRQALLRLNAPASMASLPAVLTPVPLPGDLTTGIQIIFPSLEKLRDALTLPER